MKYPNIKKAKLSHEQIAKALGYKNRNSFRCTTSHQRIMRGIDELLALTETNKLHDTFLDNVQID